MSDDKKHYAEHRHPFWKDNHKKWSYSQKVYDGTAYDVHKSKKELQKFVPQKVQRESDKAYEERMKLLDPQMHYATGIDSLVGVSFDAEQEADRQWDSEETTQGLGDPSDRDTPAGRLSRNADGDDTNWDYVLKEGAIKITMKQRIWGLVDGRPKDEKGNSIGDAKVKVIDPEHVVNWFEKDGNLTWVLVKEQRDIRQSPKQDPELKTCYVEYELDGWRRFYLDEDKNEVELGSGTYEFYRTTSKEEQDRILPIFKTEIPLPRNPGYAWARKGNAIQNFESRLDFGHMTITFALLQVAIKSDDWEQFKEKFKEGLGVLTVNPESQRDHQFLDQNSDFFSASEERLAKKIEDFYQNMFKDYGDAAAQKTAQEIRLESKSGIEAFLALLVGAVDEFENQCFWRLEQVYFPNNTKVWGNARVKRSADFSPKDMVREVNNLKARYIGNRPIPLPKEGLAQVIKRIASMDDIDLGEVEDEEIEDVAQQIIDGRSQEADMMGATGLG